MARALLARSDGLRPVPSWRGRSVVIVSRALCLFHDFDLGVVPSRRRAAALRLAIDQWSPFAEWEGLVVWGTAGRAATWIWDPSRLRSLSDGEGEVGADSFAGRVFLPESLVFAPTGSPVELLPVAQGWLARIWSNAGALVMDRFFPTFPSEAEWSSTMLSFDVSSSAVADAIKAARAASSGYGAPWAKDWEPISPRPNMRGSRLRIAAIAATIALAGGTVWLPVEFLRQQRIIAHQAGERARLDAALAPIKQARGEAIEAADQLRSWQRLDPFPPALRVLGAFAASVPAGVVVSEYQYDSGVLRATLSNPGAQMAGDLVTRLQESAAFSNVRVLPGNDPRSLRFEMDVKVTGVAR